MLNQGTLVLRCLEKHELVVFLEDEVVVNILSRRHLIDILAVAYVPIAVACLTHCLELR